MVSKHAALRTTVPVELADWVDNRLLSAHIRIVRAMVLGTLLNALVIIIATWGKISDGEVIRFAISTALAGLHRLWLAEGVARSRRQKRPEKMIHAFRMSSWWMGLNLAWPLCFWMPQLNMGEQILLTVCGVTQIASAAYTVRTLPHSATVYIAVQGLGLSLGLLQLESAAAASAVIVLTAACGLLIRMAFTARDMFVTRILSDRDLAHSARTVRLLLNEYEESGSDWLVELDAELRLHNVSPRLAMALGGEPAGFNGRPLTEIFTDDSGRDILIASLIERRSIRGLVLRPAGAEEGGAARWWSLSGRPCYPSAGDPVAFRGVVTDVTSQQLAESRAQRMASFDSLTGLPNRSLFDSEMATMLDERTADEAVALLLIDIDNFKATNDVFGHPVGDALLRDFADHLSQTVEASGLGGSRRVLARISGDEFALLIGGADACDHAVRLSERIIEGCGGTRQIEGHDLAVSASIGIALAPFHTDNKAALFSFAGIALSAAKTQGLGIWEMFEPGMDAALHEKHLLARDLRFSVTRGELRLFLQPLVDVASETRTGYEALLRWQHPERGMVAPDVFIPIAEETGLIVPIGEWVIRAALAEAASWPQGEAIAINLSPVQIGHPNLLPTIINALGETGLDPARVEFEITEGVLLNNSEANIAVLNRLHDLGVKIALDDFGTGYASLTYLLTFPFDKIKIDRRFIQDLETRSESDAIVSAVITLANQLGVVTLAEGVEERAQLARLRDQGCRMVQGWLFGKALPSEDYHPRDEIALRLSA